MERIKLEFYEEFPKKENLEKLKLIKFKTRLFIAAKSLEEFKSFEKEVKKINKKVECAYWPIIKNSYWISPFSNTSDLIELFQRLETCKNHLLIDMELPMLNKKLVIINFFNFYKNRKLIKRFLEQNKRRITTAQIPFIGLSWLLRILGLDYSSNTEKSVMWYSSMMGKKINDRIMKNLAGITDKSHYSISLGTIATGILGNEPILTPSKLRADLEYIQNLGFRKAIIFRLGGLNKNYISVITRFASEENK